jgi:hypothetical protein
MTWFNPSPSVRPSLPKGSSPALRRSVEDINGSDPLLGVLGVIPSGLHRMLTSELARKGPMPRRSTKALQRLLDDLSMQILARAWTSFGEYQRRAHPGLLTTPWDFLGGRRLVDAVSRGLPEEGCLGKARRARKVHWPRLRDAPW